MCYYTNDYYVRCRHQPLILKDICHLARQFWGLRPDPRAAYQEERTPAQDTTRKIAMEFIRDKTTMELEKPKGSQSQTPKRDETQREAAMAARSEEIKQKLGPVLRPCGKFIVLKPKEILYMDCPKCCPEPHVFLGKHEGF
ncbi:hypothetical protein RUND412_007333 [Rhizina undulata]